MGATKLSGPARVKAARSKAAIEKRKAERKKVKGAKDA